MSTFSAICGVGAILPMGRQVIIEKPFGNDSESFAELNKITSANFEVDDG